MGLKRKPPTGNVRRVLCLGNNFRGVTTNKAGHLVQFESEQERKLILLLERDPTVADFISQPETLSFLDNQHHTRKYTPDFQVWRRDGAIEFHEVTLATRRHAQEGLPPREEAALQICQERGWRYIVHTDQTLPCGSEYANLDFLSAFRATSYTSPQMATWWLGQLDGRGAVHPRTILVEADPSQEPGGLLACLYHLLWHAQIAMDWQQPLLWQGDFSPAARIWLAPHPTLDFAPGGAQ
jgi:hypothetical protein